MWTVLFGEHDAAPQASPVELEPLDEQENQQPSPRNSHETNQQPSPRNSHETHQQPHLQGKLRLSAASTAASSPPLSPSNADGMRFSSESASAIRVSESPSPPTSQQGARRASASSASAAPPLIPAPPDSTSSRRGSRGQLNNENDNDTPMAMLLRRMNQLMMKVGEHEFEKKTLVDGVRLLHHCCSYHCVECKRETHIVCG